MRRDDGVASAVPLIEVTGLRVAFDDGRRTVPVLHGVDLSIARGESLGMVGESGCGKSVTWLAVLRLLERNARIEGEVRVDGVRVAGEGVGAADASRRMGALRGRRIAMIFQDPASSLNPVHRIGYQLTEAVRLHLSVDAASARAEALRLLDRVRIPNAVGRFNAYPHELSGGMNQRVMIAIALAGRPDLLVADEPTTALDVTIQAQILDLLAEVRAESGMAMVLVSHDLGVVAHACDRVMVFYAGRAVESASASTLFDDPRHPYTRGLLAALPDASGPRRRLLSIPGTVPGAAELPAGCAFAPRCAHRITDCATQVPPLAPSAWPTGTGSVPPTGQAVAAHRIDATHQVACHLQRAVPAPAPDRRCEAPGEDPVLRTLARA
ncbi:MAG: ABC transporter ATP-binding protein [Lautropia sp.]